LRLLHGLGARRVTFFGLGPMGCIPLQRLLQRSSTACQESTNKYFSKKKESTNKLALSFNKQAGAVIKQLAASLPNATFQFGDVYDYFQDIIDRPYMHGFNNSHAPCCTLGKVRPTLTCTPLS
uniref:GDSL esterase/lipase n=2 Tax=Aegilops tauschii subsp. strangulata TaxID=200361 RepID=A0A453R6D4_AEGTS